MMDARWNNAPHWTIVRNPSISTRRSLKFHRIDLFSLKSYQSSVVLAVLVLQWRLSTSCSSSLHSVYKPSVNISFGLLSYSHAHIYKRWPLFLFGSLLFLFHLCVCVCSDSKPGTQNILIEHVIHAYAKDMRLVFLPRFFYAERVRESKFIHLFSFVCFFLNVLFSHTLFVRHQMEWDLMARLQFIGLKIIWQLNVIFRLAFLRIHWCIAP